MPLRHHTLVAWQRADDLFIEVHQLTLKAFPSFENELGSQVQRAAFSIAVNIVEGCARRHRDDRLRFLDISRASLAELGYCLHVAQRLEYITSERFAAFEKSLNQRGAALSAAFPSRPSCPSSPSRLMGHFPRPAASRSVELHLE
jgi:four helix bundle protein